MLLWILSILVGIFLLVLIAIRWGWGRISVGSTNGHEPSVSVIVAARNEGKALPTLLTGIASQNYPSTKMEVIIVDDHSEDETVPVARVFAERLNMKVLSLEKGTGKFAALQKGIEAAQNSWLVFTDADVTLHPNWLRALMNNSGNVDWISAMVAVDTRFSLLSIFQAFDMAGMMAITGASFGWNMPGLANGANLAVRREVVDKTSIVDHAKAVPSGIDVFMLEEIQHQRGSSFYFQKSQAATVFTASNPTWRQFLSQRQRWASNALTFRNPFILLVMIFGFLANLWVPVLVVWSFFRQEAFEFLGGFLVLKIIFEAIAIYPVLRINGQEQHFLPRHIVVALLYPFYILSAGFLGIFMPFHWKGRRS